ncbi:MAG: SAM-dependent methyltransferase [Bdellovibrio sp. CG10_big_fil_rev_8_21_14_0_10_47_8]|nr:MAG: SAM-dependent methyltransferase [Bdellovibrio sp. CG10_big_fil_rev_8_21_14_0_10_47_8]
MKNSSSIQHVSDTAIWVASYRALESRRTDALFHDPLAEVLTADRGQEISESMKSTERYSYWSVILRTRIIDDLLMKYLSQGPKTVINLGAGLDTRPYRLNLSSDVHWIEVDFPAVIEFKNEKLKDQKPRCHLERIALDLSSKIERQKLLAELNQRVESAIVLTEGVLPYLTEEMVAELASDLKSCSHFHHWIIEYYAPELYRRFRSQGFKKLLGNSPFQFFPKDWFLFFKNLGWQQKEIRYLYDEGENLNRKFPLPKIFALLMLFSSKAKLAQRLRLQAYLILERSPAKSKI